jgi:hypothetical protein
MTKIYIITGKAEGPCGHGEPGEKYITLASDNNGLKYYEVGEPYPAFTDREEAERFRNTIDKYDFYKITELRVR